MAGVIGGGLSKNVISAGLNPEDVYVTATENGARVYRAGPLLRKYEVP